MNLSSDLSLLSVRASDATPATVRDVSSGDRGSVIACSRQALVEFPEHELLPQLILNDQE
jgi:hypothetical protein